MPKKSLLFIWRDKKTRSYFHVGTLTYDGSKYIFEYTHHSNASRKVNDAMKHGYRLHPVFPELKRKYESENLFPVFHRRIPSKDRVDYDKILEDLQLPKNADRMDILRKTRGIIQGDPHSFEEPLRLNEHSNVLSVNFYINGMRYRDLPNNWSKMLHIGDCLYGKSKPVEGIDPYAIELHSSDGVWLGYVPGVYSQALYALLERNIELTFIIEEIRPSHSPQWWIRVRFEATLDMEGEHEFPTSQLNDLVFYVAS